MYPWLDRAPGGRDENGVWIARLPGRCRRRAAALLAAGQMERSTMLCAFALVAAESVRLRER
jgi:hypothetical protein